MSPLGRKHLTLIRLRQVVLGCVLCGTQLRDGKPMPSPIHAAQETNLIGLNPDAFSYYGMEKPLVDVIKLADPWTTMSDGKPKMDVHGWPLEDAKILVWADQQAMNGTYKLTFTGKAVVNIEWGSGSIDHQIYDPASNTTFADLICNEAGKSNMQLSFRKTAGGVKNIKLIRPGYTEGDTFTTPYKTELSKGSVLRFGFSNPVGNSEVNWSDRRLPSYFSQAQMADGTRDGSAWEYAIQLANELKRDAWIMVPAKATDDYVIQLAKLWKNGDTVDGVTYPGLDSNLNLYVEYSIEVWNPNPLFTEHQENHAAAIAEVRAGHSPLNYDGSTDPDVWAWRRVGKRIKEISDDFRSVFGDAPMGTRIRPILAAQQNTSVVGSEALMLIDNVYGDKHPVSYYIYGFGGSAYYSPNNDSDKLTLNTLFATLQTSDLIKGFQIDADWASVYGVKHVAYEGGPSLDNTGHSEAVKAAAVKDARMTNAMIAIHNAWTANGGGLLNYCCGNGDYQWGFTDNINNLDTPKFRAIDQLNQAAPAALTYGTMVPASIKAGQWSIMSGSLTNNENPITLKPLVFNTSFDPNAVYWIAYTIRADTADSYQFSVTYFSNQTGQLKVIVDGTPLEPVIIQNTNGADQTTLPLKITLGVGLHSVRLQSTQGQFRVRTLHFN